MWHEWSTLKKLIWLHILQGASAIIKTVTGTAPLVLTNAVNKAITELTQYGKCVQNGTPTPDAPVDIMCNNGALRVNRLDLDNVVNGYYWSATGVYTGTAVARLSNTIPVKRGDVIAVTTETVRSGTLNIRYNQFDDSGNWVSQTVYAQYSNAPHTEYITIAQDGFFNFSGNYIASQSTYVDWEGAVIINTTDPVFADGTPEVLTVSADGAETQTVSDVPMLLSVGDYADEAEIISGIKTGKVRAYVIDGTEKWTMSSSVSGVFLLYPADMKPCNPPQIGLSTHFRGTSASTASMPDLSIKNTYGSGGVAVLCVRYNAKTSVADFKADAAAAFASGNPWIVLYTLATEQTEQTTAHALHTSEGDNVVGVSSNVDPVELEAQYSATA